MHKSDFAGIEVSAKELLVVLRREEQTLPLQSFPNIPEGHRAVARYLARKGRVVRVCLESTGVYGLDLALRLQKQRGVEVMVANPRAVRHFAQALMQRSKTDPLDARVLLEFAVRMPFQPWQPPSATALHLGALARRLEALTDLLTAERNRLHAAGASQALPAVIRQDLRRSIAFHERAIARLTRQALQLIAADPLWQERFEQLDSIPGIAATSAIALLAELSLLAAGLDVRQWVASAGLDPREYSSGTSVRKKTRISKVGNRHLRRALYMPALVAVQHDPHLRAFYQRLLARGKPKLQALVAVMRKLLHAIFGLFKHRQSYDGSKRFPVALATREAA
ncbi:MAG: IS110 family transposase [Terriglobales bacterium]